jgi:tetratricopeptide (TPR) repeat protein
LPKARAAATRALELDPTAGEAHIALAVPLIQEYRWREAGDQFRTGLDLAPSNALGHSWHGMYLATLGRAGDALKEQQRALELDPDSPLASYGYGQTLYLLRRYDNAAHYFRRALALDSSVPRALTGLAFANLQQHNYARGIAELERAVALTPGLGRVKADLGYAYAVSGNKDKARSILNEFLQQYRPASFPGLMIAEVYIGLGERDQAFEWLHKSIDQRDLAPFLTCDPLFDSLREDERFSSLLKRTNFKT